MDHKSTILKDSHKRLTYQHRTILSDAIIYSQTFSVELAGKYNKGKSVHY